MNYKFIEVWQGKVTVEIEGVRYQFSDKASWEAYKAFRTGIYPYTHDEALCVIDADQVKVLSNVP